MTRVEGGNPMKRSKRTNLRRDERIIGATLRIIDIWTAILLLTGQITVGGVFVSSGAIWFSISGPILGNVRTEGTTPNANTVQDGIDIITAFLLILGQITNTGPWLSSGRFNLVVTGPAFGYTNVPVPISSSKRSKEAEEFFDDFTQQIMIREMNRRSKITKRPY